MLNHKLSYLKFSFIAFIFEAPLLIAYVWMMGDQTQAHFNVRQMSEWLINYEGGFVRRGLVGEIILKAASGNQILPSIYAVVFWSFLAYAFLLLLIYLRARIRNLSALAVAIVIQGGIFHMGTGNIFYTRKEGIFLVFFAILCLLYLQIQACKNERLRVWIGLFVATLLLISPLLVLMHEAYFFMGFPAALLLLWVLYKENPEQTYLGKICVLYGVEIIGLFILCSLHHGDALASQRIWESLPFADRLFLSPTAPYTPLGPIDSIAWKLDQHLATIYGVFSTGGIFIWIFFIVGNALSLAYILACTPRSKRGVVDQMTRLVLIGVTSSSAMFFIASDWGRWLAFLSNQSVMLIFALSQSKLAQLPEQNQTILAISKGIRGLDRPWILVLVIAYGLAFQMPECCVDFGHNFFPYDRYFEIFRGIP